MQLIAPQVSFFQGLISNWRLLPIPQVQLKTSSQPSVSAFRQTSFNTFSESYSVSRHSKEIDERITAGI